MIAIIGILVALLLPSVQQAREASRRISCANNLKQLVLATQAYADVQGLLPAAGIVEEKKLTYGKVRYPVFDQRSGKMLSWAVLLLPYIEETNLRDQFDFDASVLEQPNEPQSQSVPLYLCPSDAARGRFYMDQDFTLGKWFAKGNYAAYVSPFHSDLQLLYPGALIATGQKLAKVTDGTSKTVVFSEVRTREHLQDERGAWALPWNAASLLSLDMHHDQLRAGGVTAGFLASRAQLIIAQTQVPNTQGPNSDILVRCPEDDLAAAQFDGMPCHPWEWDLGLFGYISAAPRSNHIGGVNFALLDGHVGFLSDQVDPLAFAYLIDIHDAQVISDVSN